MAEGRTTLKNWRAYVDGYDLSGYTRSFGPLDCTFDEGVDDALTLNVKGTLLGSANVSMGTLNGLLDNTATSGIHAVMNSVGVRRNVLLACGIQAAPINNDPCFGGQFTQLGYDVSGETGIVTVSIPFGNMSAIAPNLAYAKPWGVLLHANAARTAANTATGLDQTAGTTKGGWMMYHVLAAAGTGSKTATIKVQHSTTTNTDGAFLDLLTSGSLNCAAGVSGIVALATTATVGQYVRWQLTLGTATSVTFALGFFRNDL